MKIKHLFIALVASLGLLVTGCNTVEGIGKDVEALGDGMQDASRDANQ